MIPIDFTLISIEYINTDRTDDIKYIKEHIDITATALFYLTDKVICFLIGIQGRKNMIAYRRVNRRIWSKI